MTLQTMAAVAVAALALQAPGCGAGDYTLHRDIPYAEAPGVDPNLLSLDVYAPPGASELPVVAMIHGGGWSIGDKAHASVGAVKGRYFTGQGYVYVSINYRLSPAVMHPVHVADVAKALAFVREHIGEYGGDPGRIYVMGHSAGAHLAALVATDARYLEALGTSPEALSGVILLDGAGYDIPANLETAGPRLRRIYETAFGTDPAVQRDASPIAHVSAEGTYPPFLIVHVADRAASRVQSESLAEALRAAGGEAEVFAAEGKTHMTLNRDIGRPGDAPTAAIEAFLAAHR